MATTWTKLRSGAWGLRGTGLQEGSSVTVTKCDGSSQTVIVGKVLWTGPDGVQLADVGKAAGSASTGQPTRRARRRGARYCEGWGADNPHPPRPPYTCDECGGDE